MPAEARTGLRARPAALRSVAALRSRRRGRPVGWAAWAAGGFLALVALLALLAPVLPLADPLAPDPGSVLVGASGSHWLGTDDLGRDTLSRLVWGARVSLAVGLGSTALAAVVGTVLGLVAGTSSGAVSTTVMGLMDVILAFPSLLLALALLTAVGPGVASLIAVLGVLFVPSFTRVVRAPVLSVSQREFVLCARAMGASRVRILGGEIFPNVADVLVTFALTSFGTAILIEGGLAFLGASVPPPAATWGRMIADGRPQLITQPQLALIPAAALVLMVLSANILGDALARRSDTRAASL